jgi:hypothetical protein
MKKLLPYEQRVIEREINRQRDKENKRSGRAAEDRSILKTDIEKLRENFGAVLTDQVRVE